MRKMTLLLVAWCIIIAVWAVDAAGSGADRCVSQYGSNSTLENACSAGTGAGVLVILFVGFIGFVFLSIIWFMTKPEGQKDLAGSSGRSRPPSRARV